MPPSVAGKSYAVLDDPQQAGRPEFQLYVQDIEQHLQRLGLVKVDFKQADYVLAFSYGVDDGKTVTTSRPVYDFVGGGTATTTGTIAKPGTPGTSFNATTTTDPEYRQVGTQTGTSIVYQRKLQIVLIDRARTDAVQGKQMFYAFEGNATSSGQTPNFNTVSRCMINAIMEDFPGENGKSKPGVTLGTQCVR